MFGIDVHVWLLGRRPVEIRRVGGGSPPQVRELAYRPGADRFDVEQVLLLPAQMTDLVRGEDQRSVFGIRPVADRRIGGGGAQAQPPQVRELAYRPVAGRGALRGGGVSSAVPSSALALPRPTAQGTPVLQHGGGETFRPVGPRAAPSLREMGLAGPMAVCTAVGPRVQAGNQPLGRPSVKVIEVSMDQCSTTGCCIQAVNGWHKGDCSIWIVTGSRR
jgi:hypothetical protein